MPLYPPSAYSPWSPTVYNGLGIVAWNYPGQHASNAGSALATAGVVYTVRVPMPGTQVTVTNIIYDLGVLGNTLTSAQNFIGLYDNGGTLIGTSADQTSTWTGGTGLKTVALASGPFTGSWPVVYVGIVFNGTTGPAFMRSYNGTGAPGVFNLNAAGANLPAGTVLTAQTSLPASLTLANLSGTTSTPQDIWVALS